MLAANDSGLLQGQAHGETQVIACLVSNYQSIVSDCQREVSRAVRMALWEYQPQLALTSEPSCLVVYHLLVAECLVKDHCSSLALYRQPMLRWMYLLQDMINHLTCCDVVCAHVHISAGCSTVHCATSTSCVLLVPAVI